MSLFGVYVMVTGSLAATAQVARGVVRAAGKLTQGDPKGALTDLAGGILAPATSAANQVCRLASEAFAVASKIVGTEEDEKFELRMPWVRKTPAEAVS